MMLDQANRKIAAAKAAAAAAPVVQLRPSTIVPPPANDVNDAFGVMLGAAPKAPRVPTLPAPTPAQLESEHPKKLEPKDGLTCGVRLPLHVHAELRRRAITNKTTIKEELLRAVMRDI